jgi:membrane protease YdiL (CAAX protease family)
VIKNNFIENATLGKNKWWQYALSILATVIVVVIVNNAIRQFLPSIKSWFPANDFGKNLFTFSCIFLILAFGVQSFFEEIVVRGYLLQGLHLHIKNLALLVIINSLIFGLLHFGYGLDSFLSSWMLGIAFAIIVIIQNRIEFVSGAHNANNLSLALVFVDLSKAINEQFSWAINWINFIFYMVALLLLVGFVIKFLKK